jgi:hypothetical protein
MSPSSCGADAGGIERIVQVSVLLLWECDALYFNPKVQPCRRSPGANVMSLVTDRLTSWRY